MKKLLLISLFISSSVFATGESTIHKFEKLGLSDIEVTPSPINGVEQVSTAEGIFYVSGDYFLAGKLYKLTDKQPIDMTNQYLMGKLNAQEKEMIIYPAKNEKHVVTVFLDTSCHYCHLLFEKVPEYNQLGITMRFMAFPRNGLHSQTAQQMEAVWTSKNPTFALKQLENEQIYPKVLKEANIVKKQYELGRKFGISGTPAIIMSNGEVLPGYIKPEQLIRILEQEEH